MESGKLRVESMEPDGKQANEAVIFKDDALITVDHDRKSYMVLDRATLENMAGTVNKAMKELEQRMAGMSPEQRAMVEKMMGKSAPGTDKPKTPPIQFHNTGKREKVGAYDCALWQAEVDGQVSWQHCVVPYGKVEGGEEMLQVMKKMAALMEEMTRSMNAEWLKGAMDAGWEGIRAIDGYPVLTPQFPRRQARRRNRAGVLAEGQRAGGELRAARRVQTTAAESELTFTRSTIRPTIQRWPNLPHFP